MTKDVMDKLTSRVRIVDDQIPCEIWLSNRENQKIFRENIATQLELFRFRDGHALLFKDAAVIVEAIG